jgi:hypothetical protein
LRATLLEHVMFWNRIASSGIFSKALALSTSRTVPYQNWKSSFSHKFPRNVPFFFCYEIQFIYNL